MLPGAVGCSFIAMPCPRLSAAILRVQRRTNIGDHHMLPWAREQPSPSTLDCVRPPRPLGSRPS